MAAAVVVMMYCSSSYFPAECSDCNRSAEIQERKKEREQNILERMLDA